MNIVYANIVHGNVDFFVCKRKIATALMIKPSKVEWFCFWPVCGSVATAVFLTCGVAVATFLVETRLITGCSTLDSEVAVLTFLTVLTFLSVITALPMWCLAWDWKKVSSSSISDVSGVTVPVSGKGVWAWGSLNWGVSGSSEVETLGAGGKKLGWSGSGLGCGSGSGLSLGVGLG